jgi:hypothetical protein
MTRVITRAMSFLARAIILTALLVTIPATIAEAQQEIVLSQPIDARADPGDGATRIDFVLGETVYALDPAYAVNACIEKVEQTVDEAILTVRLFGRVDTRSMFEPLGSFASFEPEKFDNQNVGNCIGMEAAQ